MAAPIVDPTRTVTSPADRIFDRARTTLPVAVPVVGPTGTITPASPHSSTRYAL